jgi:hypothetical protein
MNRNEFIKKVIRYILFMLLTGITLLLGNRIVSGSDCSACPGKGICTGESDCSKFLTKVNGKGEK